MVRPRRWLFAALLLLPAACGSGADTPEEVAREFLAAGAEGDFDGSWGLLAEPARNLWVETLFDLRREDPSAFSWMLPTRGVAEAVSPGEAKHLSPRDLFFAFQREVHADARPWGDPGAGSLEVREEKERAEIVWSERYLSVFLVREKGDWRVLAWGPPGWSGVVLRKGPGGRTFAACVVTRLVRKTSFDDVELPRLPGDREIGPADEGSCPVAVAADGTTFLKRVRVGPRELLGKLRAQADTSRDVNEPPPYPSLVRLDLGVDRNAPFSEVERVLRLAAGADVRFRNAVIWTVETADFDLRGVPATLRARWSAARKRVRHEPIPLGVSISSAPDGPALAGLLGAIRARPGEERAAGLRVTLPGDLPAETALRILIALSTAVDGPLVLEPSVASSDGPPRLNGAAVAPGSGEPEFPEESALDLIFEF